MPWSLGGSRPNLMLHNLSFIDKHLQLAPVCLHQLVTCFTRYLGVNFQLGNEIPPGCYFISHKISFKLLQLSGSFTFQLVAGIFWGTSHDRKIRCVVSIDILMSEKEITRGAAWLFGCICDSFVSYSKPHFRGLNLACVGLFSSAG